MRIPQAMRGFHGVEMTGYHSHRDLEQIRRIRNEAERRGHKPLRFFCKCLETDDARLPEFIREELSM